MNLLQTRKPRPFNHKLIYSDEKRISETPTGRHVSFKKDNKQDKTRHNGVPSALMIVAIVALAMLMNYLLTGEWLF